MNTLFEKIFTGVMVTLISTAIVGLVGGIVNKKTVKKEVELFFDVDLTKVGSLVVWDLSLANNSDTAFDEVIVKIPAKSMVEVDFDLKWKKVKDKSLKNSIIKGRLLKGEKVKILAIFNSKNMALSNERIKDFISKPRYMGRDLTTGQEIPKYAEVVDRKKSIKRNVFPVFFLVRFQCINSRHAILWQTNNFQFYEGPSGRKNRS